jgi:hypothetical protein
MSDIEYRCPRRSESVLGSRSGNDEWNERRPGAGRQCSYCGSLHPDDFFAAVEAGAELGPTDKSYKVYIDLPEPNPDELRVISAASYDMDEDRRLKEGWVPADQDAMKKDGWGDGYKWVRLAPRGPIIHGKFYFQHLSEEQMQRFIDFYNKKTMKIGYPGYFYSLPFFMGLGEAVK